MVLDALFAVTMEKKKNNTSIGAGCKMQQPQQEKSNERTEPLRFPAARV